MKYGITYNRKVKAGRTYEMLEIGLYREFDETLEPTKAFNYVRTMVTAWIEREQDRLLKESVKRPQVEKEEGDV